MCGFQVLGKDRKLIITHPVTYSSSYPPTHPSSTYPTSHLPMFPPTYPSTHLPTPYFCIYLPTHLVNHLYIHPLTYPSIHPLFRSPARSHIHHPPFPHLSTSHIFIELFPRLGESRLGKEGKRGLCSWVSHLMSGDGTQGNKVASSSPQSHECLP